MDREAVQTQRGRPLCRQRLGVLFGRGKIKIRLDRRFGDRERELANAAAATDLWERWFKQWSDPVETIGARIVTSETDLEQINDALREKRNVDLAIYQLLLRGCPAPPPVSPKIPVPDEVATLSSKVRKKLSFRGHENREPTTSKDRQNNKPLLFQDRITALTPAEARDDKEIFAGVWLTTQEAYGQTGARTCSRTGKRRLRSEADAMADYTLRTDAAPSLKSRLDSLKETESPRAKDLLSDAPRA